MDLIYALTIGILFAVGVFQFLRRSLLRSAMGLIIASNAINLFLLTTGAYDGVAAAYTTAAGRTSDALPQALILTAIVISMGTLSFVLALIYVLSQRLQDSEADEATALRH